MRKGIKVLFLLMMIFILIISCPVSGGVNKDESNAENEEEGNIKSEKLIIEGFNFLDSNELRKAAENLNIEKLDGYSISKSVSKAAGDILYGDVNSDGAVNVADALLTAQYCIGSDVTIDTSVADVDGSGIIDISDALLITQYYVGLIDQFPVEINSPIEINPGELVEDFESPISSGIIRQVAIQRSGRIIIIGRFYLTDFVNYPGNRYIAGLYPDGSIDDSFELNNSNYVIEELDQICLQDDGKFFIFDMFPTDKAEITRYNSDGTPDDSFILDEEIYGSVYDMKISSDGSIFIAGNIERRFADTFGQTVISYERVMKLNPDGSRDSSFNYNGSSTYSAMKIELAAFGKVVFINSHSSPSTGIYPIIQLNEDGSVDSNFVCEVTSIPNNIQRLASEKFIISDGDKIIRLNYDGSIDSEFNEYIINSSYIEKIGIQSDQKIIVCNTNYDSTLNQVVRLNEDGTIDNDFIIGEGMNVSSFDLDVSVDSTIIVGNFTNYNGTAINCIAKIKN